MLQKSTFNLNQELYYQNLLETKPITTKYIVLAHTFQKITDQSLSIKIQDQKTDNQLLFSHHLTLVMHEM